MSNIDLIAELIIEEADDPMRDRYRHPDPAARIFQVLMDVTAFVGQLQKEHRRKETDDG